MKNAMTLSSACSVIPAIGVLKQELVAELHQRVRAARGDRRLPDGALRRVRAIAQHVIPEHLHALLRNRERNAFDRTRHAIAARRELRSGGHALGGIVDALRERGAAPRGIHDHLVRALYVCRSFLCPSVSFAAYWPMFSGVIVNSGLSLANGSG